MARNKILRKKQRTNVSKNVSKKPSFPRIYKDKEYGFVSIKLNAGIETKSYLKNGVLFFENENGDVIELQVF